MDGIDLLVVMSTVGAIAFSWASFLISKRKIEEDEFEKMEQRILELMGRFKHVSSMRLEMLDRKIEEIKRVMREANDLYSSLVVKMTDIMKLKEEFMEERREKVEPPVEEVPAVEVVESKKEEKEEEEIEEDLSIEKKIVQMYDSGMSDIEIARKLGIGVGEVRLMLALFRRK